MTLPTNVLENPLLESFSLSVSALHGLTVRNNPSLSWFQAPTATALGNGYTLIYQNDVLSHFDLGSAASSGTSVGVYENPLLDDFDLWSLTDVGGFFKVQDNPNYPHCLAEALAGQLATHGTLQLSGNNEDCSCDTAVFPPTASCL